MMSKTKIETISSIYAFNTTVISFIRQTLQKQKYSKEKSNEENYSCNILKHTVKSGFLETPNETEEQVHNLTQPYIMACIFQIVYLKDAIQISGGKCIKKKNWWKIYSSVNFK